MNIPQSNEQFLGQGNFFWWLGVVEDRNDPKKLGRCRVRCIGVHTEDKQLLPTADLPWATPIQSITSAAISGVGQSPTGIVEGTWVLGFFLDGSDSQLPVILGTIAGIPTERINPAAKGFADPNNVFPRDGYLTTTDNDINKLSRNENVSDTIVTTRNNSLDTGVVIANAGGTWSEPVSAYNATYPHNHVYESENGHVWEIDDTANNKRTHRWHPSGTYEEIRNDGSKVVKIVGDHYEIIVGDKNVHIKGDCNITVDGNTNLYTKGNLNMQTTGNVNHVVTGTYSITASGNMTLIAPIVNINP